MRINVNIIVLSFVNTYSIILLAFVFVRVGFGVGLGFWVIAEVSMVDRVGRVVGLFGLDGVIGDSPLG